MGLFGQKLQKQQPLLKKNLNIFCCYLNSQIFIFLIKMSKLPLKREEKKHSSGMHFVLFDIFQLNFVLFDILWLGFVCCPPVKISDDGKIWMWEFFLILKKWKVAMLYQTTKMAWFLKLISIIWLRNCASNHDVIFQAQSV